MTVRATVKKKDVRERTLDMPSHGRREGHEERFFCLPGGGRQKPISLRRYLVPAVVFASLCES